MRIDITGKLLKHLAEKLAFLKVRIAYLIFGIEAVSGFLMKANSHLTIRILKRFGGNIGDNANIKSGLRIDNASGDEDSTGDYRNLFIGNRCYIGKNIF